MQRLLILSIIVIVVTILAKVPYRRGDSMNRLDKALSPYLLQHADNPVHWQPWDDEALKMAVDEDKPIFLSIGYSTCNWCHVMEHESFEDEEVAKLLNESFIAIKVDREERPDLDDIYMDALQIMSGGGGWPMSMFLTPDLKPFFGGTYFPRDDKYGRLGFISILNQISSSWSERRVEFEAGAQEITEN